jgi:hypothetical protein
MTRPEPMDEQILAAMHARLAALDQVVAQPWYRPRFVDRTYRPLDAVNDFPGYLVELAPEESGAELQTLDVPGSTVIALMGVSLMAYGQGSEADPTHRVLLRLLADGERALCAPGLLGNGANPENQIDVQNTRRVLEHETEVGPPWRSLMSHLYRVRYLYTRGAP